MGTSLRPVPSVGEYSYKKEGRKRGKGRRSRLFLSFCKRERKKKREKVKNDHGPHPFMTVRSGKKGGKKKKEEREKQREKKGILPAV